MWNSVLEEVYLGIPSVVLFFTDYIYFFLQARILVAIIRGPSAYTPPPKHVFVLFLFDLQLAVCLPWPPVTAAGPLRRVVEAP